MHHVANSHNHDRNVPFAFFKQLFETTAESMVITDRNGIILEVNQAFSELCGYSAEEARGHNMNLVRSGRHDQTFYQKMWHTLRSQGRWEGNIWNKKKDGSLYPAWLFINGLVGQDGQIAYFFASIRDMSELWKRERQVAFLAYYDILTRLPNRISLLKALAKAIIHNQESGQILTVFYVDIDNFKLINDVFGPSQGDVLLVQAAKRLQSLLRSNDSLYRLGGDEFMYLMQETSDEAAVYQMANRLLDAMKEPFLFEGHKVFLNVSIGISSCPTDGEIPQELLRNADQAMHKAKREGKNRYAVYSQTIHAMQQQRFHTESGIRAGLRKGEFLVHYQPKIHIASRKPAALEALIRWQKDDHLVRPDLFIPIAEESTLIDDLCAFVMESVCPFLNILKMHHVAVPISINISPRQFHNLDFVDLTERLLKQHNTDPRLLDFEITEHTAMQDAEHTLRIMHDLRQLGITLSIDDFGTGYSSLAYLGKMPVQTLKIDKQFIDEMENNDGIVSTIIAICKQMRINVVAEGVEKETQLARLAQLGCDEAQGYLFCRPEPEDVILRYLQSHGVRSPL